MTSKSFRHITFDVFKNHFEVKNHIEHPEKDVQTVRLKFKLDPAEFTTYQIQQDSSLIFSAHDLTLIIDLAESFKEEVKIIFTKNSRPMIASLLSGEESARIELVMSTIREETLKSMKKLPLATSYKQVVNSYLETRKSIHGSEALKTTQDELSDSEMHRAISPRIDTFESNLASGSNLRAERSNPQKRKSIELPNDDFDATQDIPEVEKSKKQKLDKVCSQLEEEEVSQILAGFENMDYEDDLVIGNPLRDTSSLNVLAGMEKLKFNINRKESRDTLSGGDTTDSEKQPSNERFDKSMAKFSTEDLFSNSQLIPTPRSVLMEENCGLPKKTLNQRRKKLKSNRRPRIIGADVDTNSYGQIRVECSDNESD